MTPDEYQDFKESSNAVVTDGAGRCASRRRPRRSSRRRRQRARLAAARARTTSAGASTDVVADRITPNAAFAAVSGGGIWKTTDGGANWTNLWPDANTQTMGAFAQAPNGDLWAGTGRPTRPAAA